MPVVITEEERHLPYAKYFYQDMAPIPQDKLDIWHGPMADPALATPVERRSDFLDEGRVALEVGFTVAPNGTGFVANSTFMPGVTPEMFDWWFGWHCVGPDLRYQIWDRDDHLQARAIQAARFQGTSISCNAQMTPDQIARFCALDDPGDALMSQAFSRMGLSARSHDRILRVARTIADLDGAEAIAPDHLAEAIQYRNTDILKG